MTTNNAVNSNLSGQTGTGAFVGSNTPTLVTPNLGVATATSVAFSPSTGGIIGTTIADDASSGIVGEFLTNTGTTVSVTSGVAKTIATLTLSAGSWWVWGWLQSNPATGTTMQQFIATCSLVTNTLSGNQVVSGAYIASQSGSLMAPIAINNVSGSTPIYLVGYGVFAVSTMTMTGTIMARRFR